MESHCSFVWLIEALESTLLRRHWNPSTSVNLLMSTQLLLNNPDCQTVSSAKEFFNGITT